MSASTLQPTRLRVITAKLLATMLVSALFITALLAAALLFIGFSMSEPAHSAQAGDPVQVQSTRIDRIVPNPYEPTTGTAAIEIVTAASGRLEIAIYALDGRLVARLLDEERPAGLHTVNWDGSGADGAPAPSGAYLCRMTLGKVVRTANMVVTR